MSTFSPPPPPSSRTLVADFSPASLSSLGSSRSTDPRLIVPGQRPELMASYGPGSRGQRNEAFPGWRQEWCGPIEVANLFRNGGKWGWVGGVGDCFSMGTCYWNWVNEYLTQRGLEGAGGGGGGEVGGGGGRLPLVFSSQWTSIVVSSTMYVNSFLRFLLSL